MALKEQKILGAGDGGFILFFKYKKRSQNSKKKFQINCH